MSLKIAGRLLTRRKFLPLFTLFQAGTFNDNALKNALIVLVTFGGMVLFSENLPRPALVSIAALLFTMPFLILCTIAGQLADKIDRSIILRWIKRAEMAIMCIAAIGFFLGNIYVLAFTLFCMGAQSAFFSPTKNAVLPQWLDDDELITGNSLMSGFQFFFILLGMAFGSLIILMQFPNPLITGPRIVAVTLLIFAVIGWIAAEQTPPAPAPNPDLKIDYNPFTSIYSVMKLSLEHMPVFRPMLGVAWFYGFSNILILALPTYVADILKYDQTVLTAILISSTIGILIGSLLCVVLARGREAMNLVAFGIIGVTLFTLDLYLNTQNSSRTEIAGFAEFIAAPETPRFLFSLISASLCAGLYVVPLQAMMQRRSDEALRARLMSAGAVLLNAAVNIVTFALIGLSYTSMSPQAPFMFIVIISIFVTGYALYRTVQMRKHEVA